MKKILILLFSFASIFFFCSCSTPKVMVDGVEYEALTEDDIRQICFLAELYLKNNVPNVITSQESGMIQRFDPIFSVRYNGDRTGRAIVRWELPKRNIEVVFDGKLLDPSAKCWAQTEEKYPEVLDFTKKGTLQKQLESVNMDRQKKNKSSRKSKRR